MEGFLVLIVIILIVFLITLRSKLNKIGSDFYTLQKDMMKGFNALQNEIQSTKSRPNFPPVIPKPTPKETEETPSTPSPDWSTPPKPTGPIIIGETIIPTEHPKDPPIKNPTFSEARKLVNPVAQQNTPPIQSVPPKSQFKKPPPPPKPPKPSFMERNPDLEKFIGENLLSKIGIVIFVIGMGFLVKLGIDNNVITEGMRVAIGVLIGGGMVGLAHYLRKSFSAFSSVLIGGALAVLYFTIAIAFHEYQIIPQTAAFVIMVLITAFGVLLSISYDRKELAILAIIGGFGTPFFVSTGSGNILVLFSYILILDIGMLALVYFKKWNVINYIVFAFTYLLYMGVFQTKFAENPEDTRGIMFGFLTAFYLIFYVMSIVYNVKNKLKFAYPEIGMLLTNSTIYFGFGLLLLNEFKDGQLMGLFTALIAAFNFVFTFILYKRKDIDKNLLYLLIGLVLTFISLIAPIQLEGNHITLFWSFEAVLLLWLYQKSNIQLMRISALVINFVMVISLLMDWAQNYFPNSGFVELPIILNKVFITTVISLASLFATRYLLKKDNPDELIFGYPRSVFIRAVEIGFLVLLYFGVLLELQYQFKNAEFVDTLRSILIGIYNFIFLAGLIALARQQKNQIFTYVVAAFVGFLTFGYLVIYTSVIADARNILLRSTGELNSGYYLHYVQLALFIVIVVYAIKYIKNNYGFKSMVGNYALWIASFIGVFVFSNEVVNLAIMSHYEIGGSISESLRFASKSTLPVAWAFTALVLMVSGMKYKLKTLRIASLVLFLLTIIKLFLFDLKGNTTGKIVSFIFLGIILLVISFLYQKLKVLLLDDDENEK